MSRAPWFYTPRDHSRSSMARAGRADARARRTLYLARLFSARGCITVSLSSCRVGLWRMAVSLPVATVFFLRTLFCWFGVVSFVVRGSANALVDGWRQCTGWRPCPQLSSLFFSAGSCSFSWRWQRWLRLRHSRISLPLARWLPLGRAPRLVASL